jgi:predicted nuclease of predicted toxin-antitoxin system
MPRTIRFHLDENCDLTIAEGLRRRAIDVTTTQGAGLMKASDENQLDNARRENRVVFVFSQDADFLRMHAAGVAHAGIVYCHQQSRSVGEIIRGLVVIWEVLDPEDMRGRIEFL